MKIDHIEAVHLYFEYPPAETFSTPAGPVKGRLTTLIRVHTDNGLVGVGSGYAHPALVQATIDHLNPYLKGRSLDGDFQDRIVRIWRYMSLWSRWYGRKGAAVAALGGIDQALWDLFGKVEGKPVWALLGGQRSACPAYASGLLYSSPEEVASKAGLLVERGFRRVKMRIGYSWEYDNAAVAAVRKVIGPDNDLLTDGTHRFDPESAERMADELVKHGVFWFEEPFEPHEIDEYAALTRLKKLPIAAGENEFGYEGFRELIRAKAVDIVQPDASRCGGITEVLRVAALAEENGLKFAPHSWCDPVAIIANAHAVAARANGLTVEIDQTGNRFINELLGEPLTVKDGLLELGHAPGLGIELDPAALRAFALPDPFNLPIGNHCDILVGPPSIMSPIPKYIDWADRLRPSKPQLSLGQPG
ncbi:MAG: mandelate racemase/muconate lactonizing enzyme family protein [Caulobacter sp.]